MSKAPSFMDFVQTHERTWGTEDYAGRPDLAELMQAPVVVFWEPIQWDSKLRQQQQSRLTVTLHQEVDELHEYFTKLLLRSSVVPDKRVVRIFAQQKPVIVRGIRVIFANGTDAEA